MEQLLPDGGVALLLCGSFSPITRAHVGLLGAARRHLEEQDIAGNRQFRGVISPVHDGYAKPGLAAARHRIAMATLLLNELVESGAQDTSWIVVDYWEAARPAKSRTHQVVDHVKQKYFMSPESARVHLVCGEDLVRAMAVPTAWPKASVEELMAKLVCLLVLPRCTSGDHHSLADWLGSWEFGKQVQVLLKAETIDVSSTQVRSMLARGEPADTLVGVRVAQYIQRENLYN